MTRDTVRADSTVGLTARFAIEPATWVLITALSFITVSVRADLRGLTSREAALYVALSVAVVPAIFIAVDSVLKLVKFRTVSLVAIAITAWIGAGCGRIMVESFLAIAWGLDEPALGWHVYVAQLLTLPVWAGVIGYFRALNVELAELVAQQNHLAERHRMSSTERWNELELQQEVLSKHVTDTLRPQIHQIRELLSRMDDSARSADLSSELQQVAEQSRELVRRASRETSDLAQRRYDLEGDTSGKLHTRLGGFLPASGSTSALATSVWATVLALSVTMLPVALAAGSTAWLLTCAVLIVTVIINTIAWSVLGEVFASLPSIGSWILVFVINFASPLLAYLIIVALLRSVLGIAFLPRIPAAATSLLLLSGIVITISQIWARDRYALRASAISVDSLTQKLEELDASTQAEYERVCHQTARLLHGPIQGRLAAVAMSLGLRGKSSQGIGAETLASCRGLVDACLSDLDVLMQADGSLPPLDMSLRELRRRWTGLLDIQWDIDSQAMRLIDEDSSLRSQVEDFIGDCATNASRHGAAHSLTFSARIHSGGAISLRAVDDGSGPNLPVVVGNGLGSLGVLGEDWSITRGQHGGCVIDCTMKVKDHLEIV